MSPSKQLLGLPHLTCLVVANMIGAGVFTTSGYALADLGSRQLVMLAWCVGAVVAVCGALSYGSLARCFPQSGGEYLYIGRVLHPMFGFVAGWISLTAGFTGAIAFSATALAAYVDADGSHTGLVASLAILAGTVLHLSGTRRGATIQAVVVAVKIVALLAFLLGGAVVLWNAPPIPEQAVASTCSWVEFATSVTWISLSYSGFNAAAYIAGEVRNSERIVPRSMVVATLVVSALYLGLNAVFLYAAPVEDLAGQPNVAAISAAALGGRWGEAAMRGIVVVSLFTSISSMVMIGPRVYRRMAEDGLFPRSLERCTRSPEAAVAVQGALAIVVVWVAGIRELLSYLGQTLGLCTLTAVSCLFVAHGRAWLAGTRPRASAIPPVVFFVATSTAIALSAFHRPLEFLCAVGTVALGCAVYLASRRSKALDTV